MESSFDDRLESVIKDLYKISPSAWDHWKSELVRVNNLVSIQKLSEEGLHSFVNGFYKVYCASFIRSRGVLISEFSADFVDSTPLISFLISNRFVTESRWYKLDLCQITKNGANLGNAIICCIIDSIPPKELVLQGELLPWFLMTKFLPNGGSLVKQRQFGYRFTDLQHFPTSIPSKFVDPYEDFLETNWHEIDSWWRGTNSLFKRLQEYNLVRDSEFYVSTSGGETRGKRICFPSPLISRGREILESIYNSELRNLNTELIGLEKKYWAFQGFDRWLFQLNGWEDREITEDVYRSELKDYVPYWDQMEEYLSVFESKKTIERSGSDSLEFSIINPEKFLLQFSKEGYNLISQLNGLSTIIEEEPRIEYPSPMKDSMVVAYLAFHDLEISLREFVITCMEAVFGENWLQSKIKDQWSEIYDKWVNLKEKETNKSRWLGDWEYNLIEYANFPELLNIIEKREYWEKAFKSRLKYKAGFLSKLRDLEPIRNKIAHSRSLNGLEYDLLFLNSKIIKNALRPLLNQEKSL